MPRITHQSGPFLFYWLPVILYCAAIFVQSALPSPDSLPRFAGSDKFLHAAAYAILGIPVIRILCASCFGISDEVHQYFVSARNADGMDVVADAVGAAVGVCGIYILRDGH